MFKRTYIYALAAAFLLTGWLGCMESQKISTTAYVPEKHMYYDLKKFTGSFYGGKVYINWVLNTNLSHYYFVLEKSVNGEQFKVIEVTKGFSSPTPDGLFYSYIDEDMTTVSGTYRISAVEPVKSGQDKILYASGKNLFKNLENTVITVSNENNSARK